MRLTLILISDVVLQGIISNVFWLTILVVSIILFRRELRALLGSLGSFKIAGASFELKDRKATLEYYTILTNILIEILSRRDSAEQIVQFISDNSTRQLAKFTLKYAKEVPQEDKEVELLKNVALIVGRKGNTADAITFYDSLLKQSPGERDLLNLKGVMLQDSTIQENFVAAETIFEDLVNRFPGAGKYWFNRATSKSQLGKYDESLESLRRAIELGYWNRSPRMLEKSFFRQLRAAKPQEFEALRLEIARLQKQGVQ